MIRGLSHKAMVTAFFAVVFMAAVLLPLSALCASGGGAEAEAGYCLSCHGKGGITKTFGDGGEVAAFVNANVYRSSVHGLLTCSTCHEGYSTTLHPKKAYRGRKQFSIRMARQCRRCHSDEDIKVVTVHRELLKAEKQGKAPMCQDCHGAHEAMPVSGGRIFASEERYCMGCHAHDIETTFTDGSVFPLKTDNDMLRASTHAKMSCSDCHFGFTEEEHPRRTFRSRREYSLALSELCKRCHFDKYARVSESIHYKMLTGGRTDVPNCTDCHGAHDIAKVRGDKLTSARRCSRCHAGIFEIYKGSVHGSALIGEGNPDVPVCIDCHTSHDIVDPLSEDYHERIPTMCSGCHADERIMGKYGLSTDVVKSYLSDFHGVTLELYRDEDVGMHGPNRKIAECTDCHGTHDITSNFGPNAQEVKANLVKRCRHCHKDAGQDFPDAWLSHYRPSLTHSPLVFIVDLIYRILMPIMVIGLLLQVLLHIWRFFSNR